ncbi:MAG: glycosyltransferase [Desulfobacterales bacterium]|nr:MAG: glycosyltransferase [Desulfobacterales bacterium]
MKVCLIGPTYPFRGGISHYTTLLCRHLRKTHDVRFYAFKRQYPQWLFPGETDKDNSHRVIKADGAVYLLDPLNPLSWWEVFRRAKQLRPDMVILPWWVSFWTPPFWVIVTLLKIFGRTKILFICHNVIAHESNGFDKICSCLVLRKGDYFIVHSREDAANLKRMIPAANIRQSSHPTYDVFRTKSLSKDEARQRLNIVGKTILFFGFVRPYKGLDYLIDAMPMVIKKMDVTLLIVGEFWKDPEEFKTRAEILGIAEKIRIMDRYVPNEEVGLYFAASDLIVLPYVSATGSGIVQVAFGCNKPVISTKVGCLPEVIADGKTGYLVPPQDSQAIAQAIIAFYEQAKEAEFVANIQRDRGKFSWDKMVETIESFP